MKFDLFKCVSYLTILLGLLVCLYIGYLLTYPFVVSEVDQPFKVLNKDKHVKLGEVLVLGVGITKYMDSSARITQHLLCDGGRVVSMPTRYSSLPVGSHKLTVVIPVPTETPQGKCNYVAGYDFQINGIRSIYKSLHSETFDVSN